MSADKQPNRIRTWNEGHKYPCGCVAQPDWSGGWYWEYRCGDHHHTLGALDFPQRFEEQPYG